MQDRHHDSISTDGLLAFPGLEAILRATQALPRKRRNVTERKKHAAAQKGKRASAFMQIVTTMRFA